MALNLEEVRKIATLARLRFTPEEEAVFVGQLGRIVDYIDQLQARDPDRIVTIILPEFVPARWWQQILHNQTALLIKGALLFRRNVVVTDVPYLLKH